MSGESSGSLNSNNGDDGDDPDKHHSTTDAFLFESNPIHGIICLLVKGLQFWLISIFLSNAYKKEVNDSNVDISRYFITGFVYIYVLIHTVDDFKELKMHEEKIGSFVVSFFLILWFSMKYMLLHAVFVVMNNSVDNTDRIENSLSLLLVLEIDNKIAKCLSVKKQQSKYDIASSLNLDYEILVFDLIFLALSLVFMKNLWCLRFVFVVNCLVTIAAVFIRGY